MKFVDLPIVPRPTALAHAMLRRWIREGDRVIDATAGNGHDTLFLADCVGKDGRVLAFDVQMAALSVAKKRLVDAGYEERVEFFHDSHSTMGAHANPETVAVIMFNLGYLPGEDHELTTLASETLTALEVAAQTLKSGGLLSVICYPGHASGAEEAEGVETWMSRLTEQGWRVARYGAIGTQRPAPFLLLGVKGA